MTREFFSSRAEAARQPSAWRAWNRFVEMHNAEPLKMWRSRQPSTNYSAILLALRLPNGKRRTRNLFRLWASEIPRRGWRPARARPASHGATRIRVYASLPQDPFLAAIWRRLEERLETPLRRLRREETACGDLRFTGTAYWRPPGVNTAPDLLSLIDRDGWEDWLTVTPRGGGGVLRRTEAHGVSKG